METSSLFIKLPVYISGASFINQESEPFQFHLHRHDLFSEMLLIKQGEGTFVVDGNTYAAGAGSMLLYQQGIWHKEQSTKHPFRAVYISFNGLELRGVPLNYVVNSDISPVISLGEHYPVIRKLVEECIEVYAGNEPESQQIANHLLGILLVKLVQIVYYEKKQETASKPTLDAVLLARRYMEENYRDPITLDTLARHVYVNKYHLAHLFKERLGLSPIQFLNHYRMEVARHYLQTTEYSVGQITQWVGYESEPSFYNAFKKVVGMTPRAYRERK